MNEKFSENYYILQNEGNFSIFKKSRCGSSNKYEFVEISKDKKNQTNLILSKSLRKVQSLIKTKEIYPILKESELELKELNII